MAHRACLDAARAHWHGVGLGSGSACVVIQHVGEDVLGVLESLCHFSVGGLQSLVQRQSAPLASFVHIRHLSAL